MFCISCGKNLPDQARFCPTCGTQISSSPPLGDSSVTPPAEKIVPFLNSLEPSINLEFREKLIECYLEWSTSQELSEWLKDIDQDPSGTFEEKKVRIKQNTKYLSESQSQS